MNGPITEDEHRRLYISGFCLNAAGFLLRGVLVEQWSMAREMVVNDLADLIRSIIDGRPPLQTRRTNVSLEEWRAWVADSAKEVASDATYSAALQDADRAVTSAFFPILKDGPT